MAFEDNGTGGAAAGSIADILGGGGDPAPAADPAPAGEGSADPAPALDGVDPDWYAHLSAEAGEGDVSTRDWVKALGVKDLDGLAKIARDNQKAVRDSGRVKVPGDGATPEDIANFHRAIGVPEDAKGYEIKAPIGPDGEPLPLNTPLIDRLTESAHKAGVPKGALEALVSDYIQAQLDEAADIDARGKADAEAVIKGWGAQADDKKLAVNRAAEALGMSAADLVGLRNVWGAEKTLNTLARLGAGMGEDVLVEGGRTRFGTSPAEAQAEIDRLKATPGFLEKARIKGSAEYTRWNRLQDAVAAAASKAAAG